MAYDQSVRKLLNQRNIDNSRIGYNVNTGTVTVDNKDFMRPQKNYGGTTFTDQPSFNQAYSSYFQQPNVTNLPYNPNNPATMTNLPYNPSNPASLAYLTASNLQNQQPAQPAQQAPQTSQNIIGDIYNRVMNPTPYDVYASPEYSSAQAQSQRTAQQGVRAAQEALGASGFGRSTNLAERAQGIQNQANEYLLTQVVPQLIAQNQARQQQQVSNLGSLISPLMRGEEFAKTFPLQEAQTTGQYLPPGAKELIDRALENKASWPSLDPDTQRAVAEENQLIYGQLASMGIDPSSINQDVGIGQARIAAGKLGIPTLGARQFTEGQRQFDVKAEQDASQFAEQMGLNWAKMSQDEKQFVRSLAVQQQNANTASARANESTATEGKNTVMSDAISNIDQMSPDVRKSFFQEQRAALVEQFGVSGYNQLKNMYIDQYGEPKENPSKPTSSAPSNVSGLINSTASKYGVSSSLASAVASAESNYDQSAESPAGAIGVFQLMPGTASDLGVDPYDIGQNIEGGIKYLSQQLRAFGGDIQKALAAYNWGPGSVSNAVRQYGSNWLAHAPSETRNYVSKIMSMLG